MDVSIIIPVYNCANYLEHGIALLLPLLESHWLVEVIYVNDGSTDNSASVLAYIAERYPSWISIYSQHNQGAAAARNLGLAKARGEYILFLDADDTLNLNEIANCIKLIKHQKLDFVSYKLARTDENATISGEMEVFSTFDQIVTGHQALICDYQPSSICVFIFKKAFLDSNHLRFLTGITHEDVEFTFRFMLANPKGIFLNVVAYYYLVRQDSVTTPQTQEKLEKYLYDEVLVAIEMKKQLSNFSSNEIQIAIRKNYNSVVWNFLWYLRNHKDKLSKEFMNKSLNFLKERKLFPIKGPLKTRFQQFSSLVLNIIYN